MSLIALLVTLILAALIIWAVRALLPALGLPPTIARVIEVVVIVLVVLWLLTRLVAIPNVLR